MGRKIIRLINMPLFSFNLLSKLPLSQSCHSLKLRTLIKSLLQLDISAQESSLSVSLCLFYSIFLLQAGVLPLLLPMGGRRDYKAILAECAVIGKYFTAQWLTISLFSRTPFGKTFHLLNRFYVSLPGTV